jgi:hypothetical protein
MPPGDAVQVESARPSTGLFGSGLGATAASDGGYNLFSSQGGLFGAFGGGMFGGVVRDQPQPQPHQQQPTSPGDEHDVSSSEERH